jgi:uncharacterized phage protein gp47/JayE
MAIVIKTPSQVADDYLSHLGALKPEINTGQQDSDWYVRSRVLGGAFSGVLLDQKKLSNDAFPQSARHEALDRHLDLYFGDTFKSPTVATGPLKFTGASGSLMVAGTLLTYPTNGNSYTTDEDLTLLGPSGAVTVTSVSTGQSQNLLENTILTLASPPAGFDGTAVVYGANISDGRDGETDAQASARIIDRVREKLGGGKVSDYKQFALAADPSVVAANVLRYPYGFGSVGIVITAGTQDIDGALDRGDAVVVTPSASLIETVQAYIETQKPVTDCAYVQSPGEIPIDVTVKVRYANGTNSTIPSGQTLTQAELVQREVKRALYKTPPGGFVMGGSGFVVASHIEEVIDTGLSAQPYTVGALEILVDRQVEALSATGFNRLILGNEIAVPNVLTIVEM